MKRDKTFNRQLTVMDHKSAALSGIGTPGRRSPALNAIAALLTLSMACSAFADDLGNYGRSWEIEEQDGVEQMKDKLREMERTGELKRRQEQYRDEYIDSIENPAPIPGISTAAEDRVRTFDPTKTFNETVYDENGAIMVPAGVSVNPLDFATWSKRLLFIDARDERQVELARIHRDAAPADKVILVGGSYMELMRKWGTRVYFDLGGAVTTRFGIDRVPALVSQQGKVLEIREIGMPPDEADEVGK
ncbi:type-F conjugative transfer system protein TraW [Achromobacter animicus]|uniref:type-F conjugative transfer system protein TraW n=1 Tax=Achromobacter animicus TaxID=1389935 RepID=UPI00244C95A0|nr:type-F conjugative transfer system protein TraW [Achromobacter animicus]MDH0682731.1 type-F conjugative transfer system protein TraW [Achromobacter animicus]